MWSLTVKPGEVFDLLGLADVHLPSLRRRRFRTVGWRKLNAGILCAGESPLVKWSIIDTSNVDQSEQSNSKLRLKSHSQRSIQLVCKGRLFVCDAPSCMATCAAQLREPQATAEEGVCHPSANFHWEVCPKHLSQAPPHKLVRPEVVVAPTSKFVLVT